MSGRGGGGSVKDCHKKEWMEREKEEEWVDNYTNKGGREMRRHSVGGGRCM